MKNKNLTYELMDSLLDDVAKLKGFLKSVFMESDRYDETYSILISQNLVQVIVDRLDKKDGDYYAQLLVDLHLEFGFYNGGCILFDYDTKNKNDMKKLLEKKPILDEYLLNQEEVLSMGESFSPRLIYRLNMRDRNFVKRLVKAYPYLKDLYDFQSTGQGVLSES
ncbi:MAG: hypothetical protein J6J23_07110 [Clostridia bacterium]|nr:hypothetical protein [Clostridia bacterium]